MTKLICTREFLNDLIKESIIEPRGNGEFTLYTKKNLKGESYPLTIICDHNVSEDIKTTELISNDSKSIDQWYNEIRIEFPLNTGGIFGIEGRNLRNGNKTKIKKKIQELIDQGYNLTTVITAAKYEVWYRKKVATVDDNKLDFMKGLESWLNDTSNIDAMIERSEESNEFKVAMNINNNDQSGTKRKIKLS